MSVNNDPPGFLPIARLDVLLDALARRGYRIHAAQEEHRALVLRELEPGIALPRGLQVELAAGQARLARDPLNRYFAWASVPQAIKPLAFAPQESLWRVVRGADGALRFEATQPDPPKRAVIGVRACDLAALALQDAHFLRADRPDPHYAARRASLFLVAVQCAVPAATCFCASTGDGPTPDSGYDIALAELPEGFVVTAGSAAGRELLAGLHLMPATA
ncbi:MAG: sulfite reductase subunit A, partial [Thiobacillus sp.]|nr:sulfite reductase subunit A [Thiobacillus sp.]